MYAADWKTYYNPFEGEQFELVNNTVGQVWSLNIHNDELLLGHHEGTFRVDNKQVTQLSNLPGTWTSIVLQNDNNHLLEGNYNGLNLYSFEDDILSYYKEKKQSSALIQAYSQFLRAAIYGRLK